MDYLSTDIQIGYLPARTIPSGRSRLERDADCRRRDPKLRMVDATGTHGGQVKAGTRI